MTTLTMLLGYLLGMGLAVTGYAILDDNPDAPVDYWMPMLAGNGKMPLAPDGYQFYRNVRDWGAKGDGQNDDTAAINAAASFFSQDNHTLRCGEGCGSTTTLGALVYFPPGNYVISSPVVQYYYTQFIGHPMNLSIIHGAPNFSGIALIDSNPYITNGNGSQWYINQKNFFRQIRNFHFDMMKMPSHNMDGDNNHTATGIHWQVSQATSIHNCIFDMPTSGDNVAHIGIMMENGSGGVVSNLWFNGGAIGFSAGNQQFTAMDLYFLNCQTAIRQSWNWGFLWKNIMIQNCTTGLDCTSYSNKARQGTGSITLLDGNFVDVKYGFTIPSNKTLWPNIIIENLIANNTLFVVATADGAPVKVGYPEKVLFVDDWSAGYRCLSSGPCESTNDTFSSSSSSYLSSHLQGNSTDQRGYLTRHRPSYAPVPLELFTDVVQAYHVSNMGDGDQTATINRALRENIGTIIFFPAGIYQVQGTVEIPVGSRVVGSGWSQIRGTGAFFADQHHWNVMVRVGNESDKGTVEIQDMLFTVKGPTQGAVLMEWNVNGGSEGKAAMFDSHFRVGGAAGSDMQLDVCLPSYYGTGKLEADCMGASLMLHVTQNASVYLENVWAWSADHDLDNPGNAKVFEDEHGVPVNNETQITIYTGRGILIESQGPSWLYGTASEHSQMYQYALHGASNIFMGHLQTETPYYQPYPNAMAPYEWGYFNGDPDFYECENVDPTHRWCDGSAWGMRILHGAEKIFIYSAGLYSFFRSNEATCSEIEECQPSLLEIRETNELFLFNVFTKGGQEIISPRYFENAKPLFWNQTTPNGYTSEVAAWLILSNSSNS